MSLLLADHDRTLVVLEFSSPERAADLADAWIGTASRSHRVVEVVTSDRAEAIRLARSFGGRVAA